MSDHIKKPSPKDEFGRKGPHQTNAAKPGENSSGGWVAVAAGGGVQVIRFPK